MRLEQLFMIFRHVRLDKSSVGVYVSANGLSLSEHAINYSLAQDVTPISLYDN